MGKTTCYRDFIYSGSNSSSHIEQLAFFLLTLVSKPICLFKLFILIQILWEIGFLKIHLFIFQFQTVAHADVIPLISAGQRSRDHWRVTRRQRNWNILCCLQKLPTVSFCTTAFECIELTSCFLISPCFTVLLSLWLIIGNVVVIMLLLTLRFAV